LSVSSLEDVRRIVADAQRLVVLTGAGCSTPSGIGDYRDAQGAWKRPQPVQHGDFVRSLHWRQRYWARSMVGYPAFRTAEPNPAHDILADWERGGRVQGLITQNVDRLHQRAGHRRVIDLHGRLDQAVCLSCGRLSSRDEWQLWLEQHNPRFVGAAYAAAPDGDADLEAMDLDDVVVPECLSCGGVVKPNVVFYGASVARGVVDEAFSWVDRADAMLVVGSSLMVFSSYRFARRAAEQGVPIAAVNIGKTRADDVLAAKAEVDCVTALTALSVGQSYS
jgi:NAD-dependent SIR2 family protein deacetylase